jgi:long-subunit acyl-CoA synthetase (AMP-forming)
LEKSCVATRANPRADRETGCATSDHFPNLVTMFFTRAKEQGDKPFLWAKERRRVAVRHLGGGGGQGVALAAALQRLGLEAGDRVMLVSENRPEWLLSDLAIMAAGCVTVPTYTTNTERDHQHILDDSGAQAVIVSDGQARAHPAPGRDPQLQLRACDRDRSDAGASASPATSTSWNGGS